MNEYEHANMGHDGCWGDRLEHIARPFTFGGKATGLSIAFNRLCEISEGRAESLGDLADRLGTRGLFSRFNAGQIALFNSAE